MPVFGRCFLTAHGARALHAMVRPAKLCSPQAGASFTGARSFCLAKWRCDMATVMNMGSYEIEHVDVVTDQYDDEVMCAGWNPQLALVADWPVAEVDKHMAYYSHMADMDVDAFLQQMYKYQR
jgi:hypothetical protein